MSLMDLYKFLRNNEKWVEDCCARDPLFFEHLAKGQSPSVIYIACSDSRLVDDVLGFTPGEAFVIRNVANLVQPYDLNTITAIEYALQSFQIHHIIVCGHYGCGGITAAMQQKNHGIMNPWLNSIRHTYTLHREELHDITDPIARNRRLTELSVIEQCRNLLRISSVRKAYSECGVNIAGWVFELHTGRVKDLEVSTDDLLEDIYHFEE